MELRPELLPPTLDQAKVEYLAELAELIVDRIDRGQDACPLIRSFNKEAESALTRSDFRAYPSYTDAETFVRRTLMATPNIIPNITYEELLELMMRVYNATGSETEHDYWLELLEVNLRNPRLSDLIYWPGEYFGDGNNSREMSPKELLDNALADRPEQSET